MMHNASSILSSTAHHRTRRFIALEWLRFILGLYIVVFHTLHYYPSISSWSGYITGLGFFSTSTFFILSGFLLTHVYIKPLPPDGQYGLREAKSHFLVRRLANLYPIHIGAMLITIIVMILLPLLKLAPEDMHASIRAVMFDVNNGNSVWHIMNNKELLWAVVENIFLLQAWNPYYLTFNPPTWSISTLFFFYLAFPWLAVWLWRRRNPMRWLLFTNIVYLIPPILVIAITSWGAPETGLLHRNPIIRLPEFMSGILLCVWYHRYAPPTLMWSCAAGLIGLIIATIGLGEWLLRPGHSAGWHYILHNGLMMPAQLALVYLCLFVGAPKSDFWQRWASRLGGASLPMFALHVPLYLIFSRIEMAMSGKYPANCLVSLEQCSAQAGVVSFGWYPLFLLLMVAFCVVFQEQFVLRTRVLIQKLLLKK